MTHNRADPFAVSSAEDSSPCGWFTGCLLHLLPVTLPALAHCSSRMIYLALNLSHLSGAKGQRFLRTYENEPQSRVPLGISKCVRKTGTRVVASFWFGQWTDVCGGGCVQKLLVQIRVCNSLWSLILMHSSSFFLQTLKKGGNVAKVNPYHTSNKYLWRSLFGKGSSPNPSWFKECGGLTESPCSWLHSEIHWPVWGCVCAGAISRSALCNVQVRDSACGPTYWFLIAKGQIYVPGWSDMTPAAVLGMVSLSSDSSGIVASTNPEKSSSSTHWFIIGLKWLACVPGTCCNKK